MATGLYLKNKKTDSLAREGAIHIPTKCNVSLCKPPSAEIRNRLKLYAEKEQHEHRSADQTVGTQKPCFQQ